MMKIGVIGTSNSVMRGGYTFALKDHPAVESMDNFSLGGSGSVLLAKVCHDADMGKYDYVVLDFAVNEDFWTKTGRCTMQEIRERLIDFIATKLPRGTVPIIAILPSTVGLAEMQPVHRFFREFALEYNIPLFDGYRYVEEVSRTTQTAPEQLFADRDHMTREVAYRFGTIMGDALSARAAESQYLPPRLETVPAYYFVPTGGLQIISGRSVTRVNSLTSADFVHMLAGDSATVNFEQQVHLAGIGANIAQSNDFIEFKSEVAKNYLRITSPHFKGDDKSMVYSVLPFKLVAGQNFVLTAIHREAEESHIEVAGLVVRGPQREISVPVYDMAGASSEHHFHLAEA